MRYRFTITGVTALLMHANNIEARDELEAARKRLRNSKAGDDRTPADTWKSYLYISDEGEVCLPTENLLACLLHAGAKVKLRGKETLKQHSQRIAFDRLDYPLVLADGKVITADDIAGIEGEFKEHAGAARELGFRLLVKPVTVGTSSHVRVRPMFPQWSISGVFEVDRDDEGIFTADALNDLWSAAGRLSGLGDWRPASPKRPGQYGRFQVALERA
jgi:hypothetical protein